MKTQSQTVCRRRLEVRGLVQGVGFRPFVYRLASEMRLGGFVYNHSEGVRIEIEGREPELRFFVERLTAELPPPGRIDEIEAVAIEPRGERDFRIERSEERAGAVALVLPDVATCPDCLAEILDPADRRHRYAFTNCTHCGPRFTIVRDVPYDRANTTMVGFKMCEACGAEYGHPLDRRFHAQPNACPICGPRLRLHDREGEEIAGDPIEAAADLLRRGDVLVVKGLGGYHLACDARSDAAVGLLRSRKHRDAKPLAMMVADLDGAGALGRVGPHEAALLGSPAAPIVLLERRADSGVARQVAPGVSTVGVMLAYTPLHHLLLQAVGGPLVMTSGNITDEPIAHLDDDARGRLGDLADAFLTHNRPIERRCDDSVMRSWRGHPLPLRRSRGYAPAPLRLDIGGQACILAVGGHQKNTFCLVRGREAFLSHHVGDLENDRALAAFETGITDFERLFELRPELIAHDLHPDYLATEYALDRAREEGLEAVGVQHHHAHIASCLADREHPGPVIGVSFDGTGYGPDGTVWGGEVLLADWAEYHRVGKLRPFRLAGGEAAVRQGWRVAADLAREAGETIDAGSFGVDPERYEILAQMLRSGFRCLTTTSAGRLFDGFSALLGVAGSSRYEGEAAVLLEGACQPGEKELPFAVEGGPGGWEIDWRPAVSVAVAARRSGTATGELATAFHRGLATAVAELCGRVREETGIDTVALSGGCFQNVMLLSLLADLLAARDCQVLTHRRVPPNDGGLSLGQAVVARSREKGSGPCV